LFFSAVSGDDESYFLHLYSSFPDIVNRLSKQILFKLQLCNSHSVDIIVRTPYMIKYLSSNSSVNLSDNSNIILRTAMLGSHYDAVAELLDDSRVAASWKRDMCTKLVNGR
jgi:hypothetical protein